MSFNLLEKRLIQISYEKKLSHIGSCLSCINIIDEIFSLKKDEDIFILSNGHAGLALYVVLEKYYSKNAETLFDKHGVHPSKDYDNNIYCSTGSLGVGITIACGYAISNKNRDVYCLISDGEWFEGSIQESLNFIKENNLNNLKLFCNFNGYSAYSKVDVDFISKITRQYCPWCKIYTEYDKCKLFLNWEQLKPHYATIDKNQYELLWSNL